MVDINITPFTDIVLVLLIVFMVATPILFQDSVKVNLPQASKSSKTDNPKNVSIIINDKGEVFLNKEKYNLELNTNDLKSGIMEIVGTNVSASAFVINADKSCKYDYLIRVIDILNQLGIKKILLGIELKK
jgi:biopolymer transport protein ExbD